MRGGSSNLNSKQLVMISFIELMKKLWNPANLKGTASPHELMQAISVSSNKKFNMSSPSDPVAFIPWFFS